MDCRPIVTVVCVQAALLLRVCFPPPATCSQVLTRFYRTRAGCASYTRITPVMQFVIWNVILFDIIQNLLPAPINNWIYLQYAAVLSINLDFACDCPGLGWSLLSPVIHPSRVANILFNGLTFLTPQQSF